MKVLHLLRHAKSSRDDDSLADHDRPLSKRGRRDAQAIARHLHAAKLQPDLVLSSTALRTRETLAPIQAALKPRRVVFDHDLYLAPPTTLLDHVRRLEESVTEVLMVGHNPGVHELALLLADRRSLPGLPPSTGKFPTGALASFRWDGTWRRLGPGAASLTAYMAPRELREE
ncbi:MAG TPA: histidine phosphatase family protein [Stellaceae bacterium]|nr:histidine phosphatase family protein [Stellaceae bacterium]